MASWLQDIGQRSMNLWTERPLTVLLIAGLVILGIGFGILMRTRLGQIRPLWTCAGLSVLAHILLVGYFYGTTFILPGQASSGDVVRLRLVDHTA